MMEQIDLRSDTVTHPTEAMRQAMAQADVGDDVYGEDPTVNKLEREAADLFNKEDALFVTSGTQGNLVAMLAHCERGAEIICGDKAHTVVYEQGGMSALGGIMPHPVPVHEDGTLSLDDIEHAIRADNYHFPRTGLVTLENTQGTVGGVPLSPAYIQSVADLAHAHDIPLHIDGARFFNAVTAFETTPAEMMGAADSLTFCLSKGLCAPAGSVVVGSKAFIDKARRMRKVVGGGMRQAGILAAAGRIAMHDMSQRLHEDHANAAFIGEQLQNVPGITVMSQHTNFVFLWLEDDAPLTPAEFEAQLKAHNIVVRAYPGYANKFRFVLHYWITRERAEYIVETVRNLLS